MTIQPFYQEKKITTALVVISFILQFIWLAMFFFEMMEYTMPIIIFYATFGIAAWALVFRDMLKRNFYHKKYWILFMFIFAGITPLIYVIQRHKLQRLETAFNR